MTFDIRATDLAKLNSLTKYPSIPTYHTLDPKNSGLVEEVVPFAGSVLGTEKIDGTNARIICLPDGSFVIGSREELLYGKGDLIGNPALGIVDALKELAEYVSSTHAGDISVFYLEVFGGKVTAASKQYTSTQQVAFRMFDLLRLPDYAPLLAHTPQELSRWREQGGQPFVDEDALQRAAQQAQITVTPRLFTLDAAALPHTIVDMQTFLRDQLPASHSTLDHDAGGQPEGIVLRTTTRSVIAKARFKDYERALKLRGRTR